MAPVKCFVCLGDIFGFDQQIRPVHRRIHPAGVVRPKCEANINALRALAPPPAPRPPGRRAPSPARRTPAGATPHSRWSRRHSGVGCRGGAVCHSITRSARIRSDLGMVSPRVFAVFMLMTSSKTVGRSTGSSAGLAPLKMRSMYVPRCR